MILTLTSSLTLCELSSFFSFLCCTCSLLVTVLEAFHFDHQTLSREIEAAKTREGE